MTLTKKFAAYSLILIFLTGVGTWLVVSRAVRAQVFNENEHDTQVAQREISSYLKRSDFEIGDRRLAGDEFHRQMRRGIASDFFSFWRIWSRDRRILYSSNRSLPGAHDKVEAELLRAGAGKTVVRETGFILIEGAGSSQTQRKPYLEIYAPIKIDGRIAGVFETYSDLTPVNNRIRQLNMYSIALLCGSLVVLWLILSGVVKRASETIVRQNSDLRMFAGRQAASLAELEENYLGTLRSLASTIEARCAYTSGHSQRARDLSIKIGAFMGLSPSQLDRLGAAAILHDIGKVGTPEAILNKDSSLSAEEWETMREHPAVGARIVESAPFLAHLAPIIRGHHENFDGAGYPDGLAGREIPLEARILAVADAFDALTSNRAYRGELTAPEAMGRLAAASGSHFDPDVMAAFARMHDDDLRGGRSDVEPALETASADFV